MVFFVKAFRISFLAMHRNLHSKRASEVPLVKKISMGLMAVSSVVLGLALMLMIPLLGRVINRFISTPIARLMNSQGGGVLEQAGGDLRKHFQSPALTTIMGLLTFLPVFRMATFRGSLQKRFYRTRGWPKSKTGNEIFRRRICSAN